MPGDDLLRFIGAPLPASPWWLALAIVLVVLVVTWWVGVIVWTMPPQRLRTVPLLGDLHATLIRRRFTRSIRQTSHLYVQQALSPGQASATYGRTVRAFLFLRTGIRAQYLHLGELAGGDLAAAVPLLAKLHDAQFNTDARTDVAALGRSAEELIRTWT